VAYLPKAVPEWQPTSVEIDNLPLRDGRRHTLPYTSFLIELELRRVAGWTGDLARALVLVCTLALDFDVWYPVFLLYKTISVSDTHMIGGSSHLHLLELTLELQEIVAVGGFVLALFEWWRRWRTWDDGHGLQYFWCSLALPRHTPGDTDRGIGSGRRS